MRLGAVAAVLLPALAIACSTDSLEPGELELEVQEIAPPPGFVPSASIVVNGSKVTVEGMVSGSLACTRLEGREARTGTKLTFQVRAVANGQACPAVARVLRFEGEMEDIDAGEYIFSVEHVTTEPLTVELLTQAVTIE
jgi:hypothetical protein